MTLASVARNGSALDLSQAEFTVSCRSDHELELRFKGRALPVRASVMRDAFERAGIQLQPGQTILAYREVARRCIEETLMALSLDEFRIREAKSVLLQSLHTSEGSWV